MADKERGDDRKRKSKECCGYPLSIFFIVVNEFCERFSYYGMRAVLVLYFKYFLGWNDNTATSIYHTFVALCYLTPILGAIVADSWLGKFKTIISLSIVYTIGQAVMAVSSINEITDSITVHIVLSMVGLLLIALGTGGIKPCVAAFGGDQFQDHQEKQRSTFFSIFYLSINAGSLLSTIITPILRAQKCGGLNQCYPLAFGVPAVLMAVALIVFIVGSGMYYKAAPQGNIILHVCKCIGFAISNRYRHRSKVYPKRAHWMDWAEEKYEKLLIAQIKMVLKVLFLYIPLPMFWALFDQQGSRWTLQATTMDGNFGSITIQPDQMQTVNPILILIMVPVMDAFIYPLIKKCKLNFTPLKRMTVGMFLAGIAFVVAALVQMQIDKTLPSFPSSAEGQVKFVNMRETSVSVQVNNLDVGTIPAFQASQEYVTYDTDLISVAINSQPSTIYRLSYGQRQSFLITADDVKLISDLTSKPEQGNNQIRFINGWNSIVNISINSDTPEQVFPNDVSNYTVVSEGQSTFVVNDNNGHACSYTAKFGFGSSYTYLITNQSCDQFLVPFEDIQPNSIHMAWQIPQYFLMTTGEVVFSVTGLEFSYSQAPSNMKSVLQAGWLLTVAVGNIIVLIVAEAASLPEQWAEYVLFASLLVAVCIIFAIMAYFYTYVDPSVIEAQFDEDEKKKEIRADGFHMNNKELIEPVTDQIKQTKI